MLAELLPAMVAVAERCDDPPQAMLFPSEEQAVATAVDKRRREFTTVRHCARLALAELGMPATAIVPGERGAPGWPPGIVGSMTHCAGYRGAAVARHVDVLSLGIDAEPNGPLPDGVEPLVTLPAEREQLRQLAATHPDGVCWDRLLFSAKETVYKAWYPLARRWLGFEDALLDIHPSGTFRATLQVPGPVLAAGELTTLPGRWLARDGLVLTAIVLLP